MVTGGGPYYSPLADMDFDEARRDIDDRILVTLAVARYGAARMRPPGTLLFIGGTGGRQAGIGFTLISAMTAALPPLVANLALELAPIRVEPHRRRLRRHAPVGVAPRRPARRPPRRASRHAPHRPRRRTGRRRRAGGAPHDQHRAHRRDLRHRRRPAAVADVNNCLMRSDIVPGGIFPDYALPDHTETVRKLSELQGDDPMILTLARGHYCPKEHQQHLELAAFQPKIAVAYTQIVTISTDDHHELQEFRASVGAQWTFLSDPGRTIQQDLDIQEYTDPDHDPMIPHTLVLKPGLVVHSIYNGYWFWGRPSVDDLWRDLRAATSEIRPDWDLSTPGLREAWDAGD